MGQGSSRGYTRTAAEYDNPRPAGEYDNLRMIDKKLKQSIDSMSETASKATLQAELKDAKDSLSAINATTKDSVIAKYRALCGKVGLDDCIYAFPGYSFEEMKTGISAPAVVNQLPGHLSDYSGQTVTQLFERCHAAEELARQDIMRRTASMEKHQQNRVFKQYFEAADQFDRARRLFNKPRPHNDTIDSHEIEKILVDAIAKFSAISGGTDSAIKLFANNNLSDTISGGLDRLLSMDQQHMLIAALVILVLLVLWYQYYYKKSSFSIMGKKIRLPMRARA